MHRSEHIFLPFLISGLDIDSIYEMKCYCVGFGVLVVLQAYKARFRGLCSCSGGNSMHILWDILYLLKDGNSIVDPINDIKIDISYPNLLTKWILYTHDIYHQHHFAAPKRSQKINHIPNTTKTQCTSPWIASCDFGRGLGDNDSEICRVRCIVINGSWWWQTVEHFTKCHRIWGRHTIGYRN